MHQDGSRLIWFNHFDSRAGLVPCRRLVAELNNGLIHITGEFLRNRENLNDRFETLLHQGSGSALR